jgi:hypothetical protein
MARASARLPAQNVKLKLDRAIAMARVPLFVARTGRVCQTTATASHDVAGDSLLIRLRRAVGQGVRAGSARATACGVMSVTEAAIEHGRDRRRGIVFAC